MRFYKTKFKVGDRVLQPESGEYATVVQTPVWYDMPESVKLDRRVDGLFCWHEDALDLVLEVADGP